MRTLLYSSYFYRRLSVPLYQEVIVNENEINEIINSTAVRTETRKKARNVPAIVKGIDIKNVCVVECYISFACVGIPKSKKFVNFVLVTKFGDIVLEVWTAIYQSG